MGVKEQRQREKECNGPFFIALPDYILTLVKIIWGKKSEKGKEREMERRDKKENHNKPIKIQFLKTKK